MIHRVEFVDSHTGGEPTRLILAGGPELGSGPLADRATRLRHNFDGWRAGFVQEPRGSDVFVGALLVEPHEAGCSFGVIFFNDVGTLGMCGHGTIGVVASLAWLGRLSPGRHRIDTPVGVVEADLLEDGRVAVDNVPSYRYRNNVVVEPHGLGPVVGDIAWGGNWFFLAPAPAEVALDLNAVPQLLAHTQAIRAALERQGITAAGGAVVDHIELVGPSPTGADARGFVLCPGAAWDRSPCGTGTSAKVACLAADRKLAPGAIWRQESVVGSVFEAHYREGNAEGLVLPTVVGRAFVIATGELLFDDEDPFRWGLGGAGGRTDRWEEL